MVHLPRWPQSQHPNPSHNPNLTADNLWSQHAIGNRVLPVCTIPMVWKGGGTILLTWEWRTPQNGNDKETTTLSSPSILYFVLISFAFPIFLRNLIIPGAMASRHGGLCLYIKAILGFISPSVVFPGGTWSHCHDSIEESLCTLYLGLWIG